MHHRTRAYVEVMAVRRLLSAVAALLLLTGCTEKVIAPSSPVSELGVRQLAASHSP